MSCKYIFCLLIFCMLHFQGLRASHFRGGTISWKHLRQNAGVHEVEFSFRFGYRRDFNSDRCDDNTIRNRTLGYAHGAWNWIGSGISVSAPNITTALICTTYEPYENWAYGYNSFLANISASEPFSLRFSGNAWIDGMYQASGLWSVALKNISFARRSDTGIPNRPPSTLTPPIVRLQQGCPATIVLNIADDDNDNVTCRYAIASSTVDECAGVCGVRYPHFTLDQTTCSIHYNGGGGTYLIPVALMLEDHPTQNIRLGNNSAATPFNSLSQVPLQFLIDISSTSSCNELPTYPSISISANAIIAISVSGSLNETLYAYPSGPTIVIIRFVVLGPPGVETSPIQNLGNGLFSSNVTWQPDPNQTGNHTICYYAVDTIGKNGRQRCFGVSIAAKTSPCDVENGGCSDICVPEGSRHSCLCSLPCWKLTHDRKTCVPEMEVTCNGENVDIYVEQCASNRTVVAGTNFDYFTQTTCQSVSEESRHHLNFSSHDCALDIQANPIEVTYSMYIWVWESNEIVPSSVVTRGQWRNVPVTCTLPSSSNITGSFVPVLPLSDEFFPRDVTIQGMGSFSLFFEFYRSVTYTTVIGPNDYPLSVRVKDVIYFSLGAVGQDNLVFFTEECVASAVGSSAQPDLTYIFIENGCFLDPTLRRHNTSDPMENRFSIQAFEFESNLLKDRETAEISLQCSVTLCDATDSTSRCFQGCLPARAKRSFQSDIKAAKSRQVRETEKKDETLKRPTLSQSPPQNVNNKFILIVEPISNDDDVSKDSNYINWILIGVGVFLLFVACLIAYRLLKNKRLISGNFNGENPKSSTCDNRHQISFINS